MHKRVIKNIACILIVCLLNALFSSVVFSQPLTDTKAVEDIIEKLTPQQKQEAQKSVGDLTPSNIQNVLKGSVPEGEKKISESMPVNQPSSSTISEGISSPFRESQELSKIEQGFLSILGESISRPIQQFGYDIFSKAVSNQFVLMPSIPIDPNYVIHSKDQLLVTIWGNVYDAFSLTVDERGAVNIPKIGVISIAGVSLAKAKELIYQRLSKVFVVDFNIDLTIKEIGSIKVYLLGEFNKPGAYTLLANTNLYDAVFIGGGPTKNGSLRNVELIRNGNRIKIIDLYDFVIHGNKRNDILIQSGDVIKIPSIGHVAAISGNVYRPAIYELNGRLELASFINLAGGFTPTAYLSRVQILRQQQNKMISSIDLNYSEYLKQRYSKPVYVENMDFISVFSIDSTVRNVVTISGNVIRPGTYQITPNMKLFNLLEKSQGLAPATYMKRAQINRKVKGNRKPKVISVNLELLKSGDSNNDPLIQEFDEVRIYAEKDIVGEPMVFIGGAVNDGEKKVKLVDNMKVSDLIYSAGGVKDSAYLESAELTRNIEGTNTEFFKLNLYKILKSDNKTEDIILKKNDRLFIRSIPDFGPNEVVTISGNVKYPGRYSIYKGEKISSLISRAGGFNEQAFLEGAVFVRESLKIRQSQEREKIKRDIENRRNLDLMQILPGTPLEEAEPKALQINRAYDLAIKKLDMDVPGRISINLASIQTGGAEDMILQANDSLFIPDKVNAVSVFGAVFFPASIMYEKGKSIDYYIESSGADPDFADTGKSVLLRSNGKVEKRTWSTHINPGDSIFVPQKPISSAVYQKPFDWNQFWSTTATNTTTLVQMATSLATLYLLIKNLRQ